MTNRYLEQAKEDYEGTPVAIADHEDSYGEQHVIVKMDLGKGNFFYLDWIGGEYAEEPDEFDQEPFINLEWIELKFVLAL